MLGVVYEVPACNDDPPVDAAYQFTIPALAVAPRFTVPASHTEPGVVPDIDGVVFTVATTAVLDVETQLPKVAST